MTELGALSLCDSHCHLDAPEFDVDRNAVVKAAQAEGVHQIIVPAIDAAGFDGVLAIAAGYPGVYPAYGLHPMYLARHRREHLDVLSRWLREHRPCAVGEFGLDGFMPDSDPVAQQWYFDAQLRLAAEHQLPVILHARKALDQVLAGLRRHRGLRGVVHSFSGSLQQATQLFDLGFKLGIGGPLTYPRASRLAQIVRCLPIEALLIETDAPDQPLCGFQGQRNSPAQLPGVFTAVQQLRDMDAPALAAALAANLLDLFGIAAASTASGH